MSYGLFMRMHSRRNSSLDWTGQQEVFCCLRCSTDDAVGVVSLDLVYAYVRLALSSAYAGDRFNLPSRLDAVLDLVADVWLEMTVERASLFVVPGRLPV